MAKRKSQLRYAPKPKKKNRSKVTSLSKRTNIKVEIGGTIGVEDVTADLISKKHSQESAELRAAIAFANWLKTQTFTLSDYSEVYGGELVRAVFKRDVLSVAGSLGAGGRYNVGFAQAVTNIPQLNPFGATAGLYFGDCFDTAKAEAGFGHWDFYAIRRKTPATLWSIAKLLPDLSYPDIAAALNSSPISSAWPTQKVPLISQLLGHFLRSIGGDGIIFESNKNPPNKVVYLFLKDDEESKLHLSASLITSAAQEQLPLTSVLKSD